MSQEEYKLYVWKTELSPTNLEDQLSRVEQIL